MPLVRLRISRRLCAHSEIRLAHPRLRPSQRCLFQFAPECFYHDQSGYAKIFFGLSFVQSRLAWFRTCVALPPPPTSSNYVCQSRGFLVCCSPEQCVQKVFWLCCQIHVDLPVLGLAGACVPGPAFHHRAPGFVKEGSLDNFGVTSLPGEVRIAYLCCLHVLSPALSGSAGLERISQISGLSVHTDRFWGGSPAWD